MFEVFPIMRDLHELLWYLTEALTLRPARPIHGELSLALEDTERLTHHDPGVLLKLDGSAIRRDVNALLLRASELVRAGVRHKLDHRGADLIGAKLAGADLSGANLRGAYLSGAHLTDSIFLIQSQLDAAKGDTETRLPPWLARPTHWSPQGT
jgi:hypothetical protein